MAHIFAYVGTFTTAARQARGDGIRVFRIDGDAAAWTQIQHVGGLTNPSFLVLAPRLQRLFAVHGDETYATTFAVDPNTGQIEMLGQAATGGLNGVRQDIDAAGRFLVVANYSSGTVAVLAIRPDRTLADCHQVLSLEGRPGPNPTQQASSHPHDVRFDPTGRFVLIPDKGLDQTFIFRADAEAMRLEPAGSIKAASGAGPRHLAFSPDGRILWVLNELNSTVTAHDWDAKTGSAIVIQTLSTLPPSLDGTSTAAEIAVSADGRFVYCSNRGHDSIAVFAVEPGTGQLRPAGWQSTGGSGPRFIGLDPSGRHLYAANEQGDQIVAFHVDRSTGAVAPTGQIVPVASPAVIAFLDPAAG